MDRDHIQLLAGFGLTPESVGAHAEAMFARRLVTLRGDAQRVYAFLDARRGDAAPACWYYTDLPRARGRVAPAGSRIDVAAQFIPDGPAARMALKMAGGFAGGLTRDSLVAFVNRSVNDGLAYQTAVYLREAADAPQTLARTHLDDVTAAVLIYPKGEGAALHPVAVRWADRGEGVFEAFGRTGPAMSIARLMDPLASTSLPAGGTAG